LQKEQRFGIIRLIYNDIMHEKVHAIVNPCKNSMKHYGGMGKDIVKQGGKSI